MLEKLGSILNFIRYRSNTLLFRIFFTIGFTGYIWRLIEAQLVDVSPANITTLIGVSGVILTFIWAKQKDN